MDKSKLLKRSFAVLLAVLLVVAMIPFSASAAIIVRDGDINRIEAANGTLKLVAGSKTEMTDDLKVEDKGDVFTILTYNRRAVYVSIETPETQADDPVAAKKTDDNTFVIDTTVDYDGEEIGYGDTFLVYLYVVPTEDDAGTVDDENVPLLNDPHYTITMSRPVPSSSTALDKAEVTYNNGTKDAKVEGTVSGNTITFVKPWGFTTDATEVTVTVDGGSEETLAIEDGAITVTAQDGKRTTKYTVVQEALGGLEALSVNGIAAVEGKDSEGKSNGEYTVTLPLGTEVDKDGKTDKLALTYTLPVEGELWADFVKDTESDPPSAAIAHESGEKIAFEVNKKYELSFKDADENELTGYYLTVLLEKSSEVGLKAAQMAVTVGEAPNTVNFTEDAVIDGENHSVTFSLPYGTDLKKVTLVITPEDEKITSIKATPAISGTPDDKKVYTYENVDLSVIAAELIELEVTAEDGVANEFYDVFWDVAEQGNSDPRILEATVTIRDKEYNAVVGDHLLTFNDIPYGLTDDELGELTPADFSFVKTTATIVTMLNDGKAAAANEKLDYSLDNTANEIQLTSDDPNALATYKVTFNKGAASTGKALTKLDFTTAAKADDVTEKNTIVGEIGEDTVKINLTAAQDSAADTERAVVLMEADEGARILFAEKLTDDLTDATVTADMTGYNKDGEPNVKATVPLNKIEETFNGAYIMVLDETASLAFAEADTPTMRWIRNRNDYRNHFTLYQITVEVADRETGYELIALNEETGLVETAVDGEARTASLEFPGSYADETYKVEIEASKGAKVNFLANNVLAFTATAGDTVVLQAKDADPEGGTVLVATPNELDPESPIFKEFDEIEIVSDNGIDTQSYEVTVTAKESHSGYNLISVTANGVEAAVHGRKATVALKENTDLTEVELVIDVSEMAKIEAGGKSARTTLTATVDATNAVKVVVTAEDGKNKATYTVEVTADLPLSTDAELISLYVEYLDDEGTTNSGALAEIEDTEVTATVPADVDLSDVTLRVFIPDGATLAVEGAGEITQPDSGYAVPVDATEPLELVITAEDGKTANTYTVTVLAEDDKSAEAELTALIANEVDAEIDGTDVTVTLPAGTDATKVELVFTASEGATAEIGEETVEAEAGRFVATVDATEPVEILIIAENGTDAETYTLTVTVEKAKSTEAELLTLSVNGTAAEIKDTAVTAEVAADADLTKAALAFTVSEGATAAITGVEITKSENSLTATVDASKAVTLVVTAEDGATTKTYTLTVTAEGEKSDEAELLTLSVNGKAVTVEGTELAVEVAADADLTKTALVFTVSEGATAAIEGVEITETENGLTATVDATEPVELVVVAEDDDNTETYTITVTKASDDSNATPAAAKINGEDATIGENKIIGSAATAAAAQNASLEVTLPEGATAKLNGTALEAKDGKVTATIDATKAEEQVNKLEITSKDGTTVKTYELVALTDVADKTWYTDAVEWAIDQNITKGTSATTFVPEGNATRAQMVTFLWRAAGSPKPEITTTKFTDLRAGQYYTDAALWAVEKGITQGVSETRFDPNGIVNRAQAVTFLYRAFGAPEVSGVRNPFTDVAAKDYFYDAVLWAYGNQVTTGMTATTFEPASSCKRAQIVTFLNRAYAKTEDVAK